MNKLVLFAFFLIIASLIIANSSAVKAQNYCEYYYKKTGGECRGGTGPTNDWCAHDDFNIYSFCGYSLDSSCTNIYDINTRYYFGCINCGFLGTGGCCDKNNIHTESCAYGCDASTGQCKPQPFDFSLSLDPSSGSVIRGNSITNIAVSACLESSGPSQPVSFSVTSTLPTGVTVSFDPTSCTPDCGSTMTISTLSTISPGSYAITITGTGGGKTHSTTYTLTVTSTTCTIGGTQYPNGYCNGVCQYCDVSKDTTHFSNVPSGMVCDTDNNRLVNVDDASPLYYCYHGGGCSIGDCSGKEWWTSCNGAGSCRAAGTSPPTGSHIHTYTAANGKVLLSDCSQASVSTSKYCGTPVGTCNTPSTCDGSKLYKGCYQGSCSSDPNYGYTDTSDNSACDGQVCSSTAYCGSCAWYTGKKCSAGSCSQGYGGASCNPYTCSGTSCTSTCSKSCGARCASNADCAGGTCQADCTCSAAAFDFSLSVNPSSGTVTQGSNTQAIVTATLASGNTQSVSFSVSGLPSGASASFTPASCNPTCTSTMNITTSPTTPAGTYTITVNGTGGGKTHSTTYTLTVNLPSTPYLSLSASPTSVVADGSSTSTITATTSDSASGKVISFTTTVGTLSSSSCTTTSGSCSVTIKSSSTGTAAITGTATGYTSDSATVTFTSTPSTWSISLSASSTSLPVGSSTTLNATANQDVQSTTYSILIYEGSTIIKTCATGTSCLITVTKSTASTHSYTAKVASYDGSNVQATSNVVSVTWTGQPTISLSASPTSVVADGSSTSTITATTSDSASGKVISFTTTVGTLSSSSCTTTSGSCSVTIKSSSTGTAAITGTATGYTSDSATVTFTSTPSVWSISLSASSTSLPVGSSTTLNATTNKDVGPTAYYILIYEGSTKIYNCRSGTSCQTIVTKSTADTYSYTAKVASYDGSNVQATSKIVDVTWTAISPGCSGSVALTLNPSAVVPSGSVTPSASGLSDCDGKTVNFTIGSCTGTRVSFCSASGSGCTGDVFTAPDTVGSYSYYACINKNGDSDFDDAGEKNSTSLTVAAECIRDNPNVTANPSEVPRQAGENHTFTIAVTNKDYPVCNNSTFNLTTDCPQGWQCTLNPNSLLISPGSSNSSNLTIKSASTAALGKYLINLTVVNRADTKYNATKSIGFILISKCDGASIQITDSYVYNNSAKITVKNNGTAGNLTITSAEIIDKSGKIYKPNNLPITNFDVKETEYINFSKAPNCTDVSKVNVSTNCPTASAISAEVRCPTAPPTATIEIVNVVHKNRIVNATLKNIGDEAIDSGLIKILLNGEAVECKPTFTLAPESSEECDISDNVSGFVCTGTLAKLEITGPNMDEKEFECEKSIEITVQFCKDADCNQPLETLTKGEEAYFEVETDPAGADVTAVVKNGGTETIDLTEPFKPEEVGSYTIELTASKEGYSETTSERSFVVEAKSSALSKIIIVFLVIILALAGFVYYRLKKTRKTETYEKLYEKYGKNMTYEDLYRKYGRKRTNEGLHKRFRRFRRR